MANGGFARTAAATLVVLLFLAPLTTASRSLHYGSRSAKAAAASATNDPTKPPAAPSRSLAVVERRNTGWVACEECPKWRWTSHSHSGSHSTSASDYGPYYKTPTASWTPRPSSPTPAPTKRATETPNPYSGGGSGGRGGSKSTSAHGPGSSASTASSSPNPRPDPADAILGPFFFVASVLLILFFLYSTVFVLVVRLGIFQDQDVLAEGRLYICGRNRGVWVPVFWFVRLYLRDAAAGGVGGRDGRVHHCMTREERREALEEIFETISPFDDVDDGGEVGDGGEEAEAEAEAAQPEVQAETAVAVEAAPATVTAEAEAALDAVPVAATAEAEAEASLQRDHPVVPQDRPDGPRHEIAMGVTIDAGLDPSEGPVDDGERGGSGGDDTILDAGEEGSPATVAMQTGSGCLSDAEESRSSIPDPSVGDLGSKVEEIQGPSSSSEETAADDVDNRSELTSSLQGTGVGVPLGPAMALPAHTNETRGDRHDEATEATGDSVAEATSPDAREEDPMGNAVEGGDGNGDGNGIDGDDDSLDGWDHVGEETDAMMCSICLDEYEIGDACVASASCPHRFHRDCALDWLTRRNNTACPCCRQDMVDNEDVWEVVRRNRSERRSRNRKRRKDKALGGWRCIRRACCSPRSVRIQRGRGRWGGWTGRQSSVASAGVPATVPGGADDDTAIVVDLSPPLTSAGGHDVDLELGYAAT